MKKAFPLLAGLLLVVALACNINFVAPVAPEDPGLPSEAVMPGEVTELPTGTPTLTPTTALPVAPPAVLASPTFTSTTGFLVINPAIILVSTDTPIPPKLNYSQPANYGNQNLGSGFVPDPFQIGMTSGGNVDVSYLGGGCSGFATSASDLRLNYTAGAFPMLRIYFIGSQDTTLIVNTPPGSYLCNDDSFGTLNPTIDINSPAGGNYDIWVGSYSSGTYVSGTLYVTENAGNHP